MAYVDGQLNKKEEDEENPANTEVFTGRGSAAIEPAAVGGSSNGPVQVNNPQNNQKTFAGILDYVKANKGQTAKLANTLGDTVKQAGTEARTALDTGTTKFNKDVTDNTIGVNTDVFNAANADPTSVGGTTRFDAVPKTDTKNFVDVGKSRFSNYTRSPNQNNIVTDVEIPDEIAKDAKTVGDLKEFEKMRDAEYKGPNSLQETEHFRPIDKSFNKAEDLTENAKTEQGNRALLDDLQTKQLGYTNQGSLLLNNALLRGDVDARNILQGAAASNADLDDLLSGALKTSIKTADAGEATTAATRKKIQDTFGGRQGEMEADLAKRSDETFQKAEAQSQQIMNTLLSGATPTDEQLELMGVTPAQWHQLQESMMIYNIEHGDETPNPNDLMNYLTTQMPEISPQNIASKEEYARYQALNRLMGTDGQFLSDPSLAGTAQTDNVDFDIDAALADMEALYPEPPPPEPTKHRMGQANNIAEARRSAARNRNGSGRK